MKNNKNDIFTSLDLEMNQPSGKIIQIGAVVGNIRTGEILDRFSMHVNCNEILNPEIIKLTGITQKQVNSGVDLLEAFRQLRELHLKHGSFINPITWGGGDAQEIKLQLEYEFVKEAIGSWPFGRRWIDVKTFFVGYRIANEEEIQGGLARAMTKVGLKFEGRKHDAQDDAENTFRMYIRMLSLFKIEDKGEKIT